MESRLQRDLVTAMKEKNVSKVTVLREIKTAISNFKTSPNYKGEYTDSDILNIIQKISKQHKDSVQMYSDAGRKDLVEEEPAEPVEEQVEEQPEEAQSQEMEEHLEEEHQEEDDRHEDFMKTIEGLQARIEALESIVSKLGTPVEEDVGVSPSNPSGEGMQENEFDRINKLRRGK